MFHETYILFNRKHILEMIELVNVKCDTLILIEINTGMLLNSVAPPLRLTVHLLIINLSAMLKILFRF